MIIIEQTDDAWPYEDYDVARRLVEDLKDDEAAAINLYDENRCIDFRKIIQQHARETLRCYENGWSLPTTIRGGTLILKRAKL